MKSHTDGTLTSAFSIYWLCGLKQVTLPSWVSVSTSEKQGEWAPSPQVAIMLKRGEADGAHSIVPGPKWGSVNDIYYPLVKYLSRSKRKLWGRCRSGCRGGNRILVLKNLKDQERASQDWLHEARPEMKAVPSALGPPPLCLPAAAGHSWVAVMLQSHGHLH